MCSRRFQPGEDPSSDCENLLWNQWIVCSTITRGGGVPIPFDIDITIYPETRLLFNHQSCSNSLSEECSDFHRDFGRVTTTFNLSGDRVTEEAQCSGREELYHQVQVSLLLYKDRRLLRGGQPGSGGRDLGWAGLISGWAICCVLDSDLCQASDGYYWFMLLVPLGIFMCSCFFCIACSFIIIVDEQGKEQDSLPKL